MLRLIAASLALVALVAACGPTDGSGKPLHIGSAQTQSVRNGHVQTVNEIRAQAGLPPLVLSAELTAAALTQARDMAVQRRAWHFGSDATSPQDRAARAGYFGIIKGENIAENYAREDELIQTWMADPETRRLILTPDARDIGFGWYQESDGRLWWVQVIG
jgi:uncharacterized protein YkwD